MIKWQRIKTDKLFSRAATYGLLAVLTAAGYALLVSGFSLITSQAFDLSNPWLIGATVFLLAVLFNPLRERLQHATDAFFFHGEKAYEEKVQAFSHELTNAIELAEITAALRKSIRQSLSPGLLHIFIYDPSSDQYVATPDDQGRPTSELRFGAASGLVQHLNRQHAPFYYAREGSRPARLAQDEARLKLLAAETFVPLSGRQRLAGWIALSARGAQEPYSSRDLLFLEALADQAALAISRAQVVANLEARVRETNALARVAQGLNITLRFDDILELIYAQTAQIIPTRDFRLTLLNKETGVFTYVFYVEDDERLGQEENQPLAQGDGLEQEVAGSRRALLTGDYPSECQRRNLLPNAPGVYAWMGVPLNAGAETIGALSLGSRDPAVTYTNDQLSLAQAIADQTAGAIVKAQLLQETERRARQLATINEVTRQLTSTLDLEPLLQNILESAAEILNCEAGSLLLVDEQTGELVFRVTVGPVAGDLVNKRLPPGSGMVGKSVATRRPLIVNDVQHAAEWFSKTDQQTGFITRALLVVPLQVKDTVIGVIEVINKRDGSPFQREEQGLLESFAGQAAVAIENARLYTLTDKALTSRVEELSVMQRIDRELNTSLDITRAMSITLDWAMRQSGSNAGLIGAIEEEGVKIVASQGYSDELAPYQEGGFPAEFLGLQAVLRSGQPQRTRLEDAPNQAQLLRGAASRLVIPIRREVLGIGVLILESARPEAYPDETLAFLSRLSDHAAIAIANAQLYAAVQAANVAKSEFVSFVSHELKNPMTSIKGYTELLAAGAVGPINEAQGNFLNTIRSNVERMSTLVSDLADVSRIEAGRLRLDFKAIRLSEISDEVIRSTKRQIDDKRQVLTLAIPADLPPLWADHTRLSQVLVNLVSNAYKYTPPEGSITLAAEKCANRWNPNGAAEVVHVWVQDSGIGISAEDQKKIFQKFFRSEDPKTREAPGTGLGLNITRSLVEMQGGQIWFESEFRKGTTFHFTVPVAS